LLPSADGEGLQLQHWTGVRSRTLPCRDWRSAVVAQQRALLPWNRPRLILPNPLHFISHPTTARPYVVSLSFTSFGFMG
jgi:hypothetical protein